jgi:phytoene desaturase
LSAACHLAKAGFSVTVYEKSNTIGGRARQFVQEGFTFDMGPSWYWMPDVFEAFFRRFNKKVSDYYHLVQLDPGFRIIYKNQEIVDIPARKEDLFSLFEEIEPGSGPNLKAFLRDAEYKYNVGMQDLVYKPGLRLSEFADTRLIKGIIQMDVFKGFDKLLKKYFSDPKILQLMEFPILFLGATAKKTPALYSLMNYAGLALGTWYPMGGMYKIIEGMAKLARDLGVQFEVDSEVESIICAGHRANGIVINGRLQQSDVILSGADYHHTEQLLPAMYRNYSQRYWDSRIMAPSSLLFYLGINKKLSSLEHHNLFFDEDLKQHSIEIYEKPQWPSKPLFYVCCPSKTDPSVAPAGSENLCILMPLAPGIQDTETLRNKYFEVMMSRLEKITNQAIKKHVVTRRSYAINDFIKDYHAFQGNAYGLANTLKQTALLKPKIKNKKLTNLFYTGHLTVPGPGVPPSIISGKVVSDQIIKHFHKK